MTTFWSGPRGGIGNRLLALAAASTVAEMMKREVRFSWLTDDECPCRYSDLFQEIPGLTVADGPATDQVALATSGWHPLEIRRQFQRGLNVDINEYEFSRLFIWKLRAMPYSLPVQTEVAETCTGGTVAVHLRRTDRLLLHRHIYRHRLRALPIIRNTGLLKSFQYLLLSDRQIEYIEDRHMAHLVRRHLSELPMHGYSIYGDSLEDIAVLRTRIAAAGVPESRFRPAHCMRKGEQAWKTLGLRLTHPRDALVDLLEMSNAVALIQNNPASTFSLVAAIIGGVPILSAQPSHDFWRGLRKTLGCDPNRFTEDCRDG